MSWVRTKKERIVAGLRKLVDYAQEVVKKVPQVIEDAQSKVDQLLEECEQKAARGIEELKQQLSCDAELVKRVFHQVEQRLGGVDLPGKIYSLHEPHVACIRKGKRS